MPGFTDFPFGSHPPGPRGAPPPRAPPLSPGSAPGLSSCLGGAPAADPSGRRPSAQTKVIAECAAVPPPRARRRPAGEREGKGPAGGSCRRALPPGAGDGAGGGAARGDSAPPAPAGPAGKARRGGVRGGGAAPRAPRRGGAAPAAPGVRRPRPAPLRLPGEAAASRQVPKPAGFIPRLKCA